jgi:hypothetical protein
MSSRSPAQTRQRNILTFRLTIDIIFMYEYDIIIICFFVRNTVKVGQKVPWQIDMFAPVLFQVPGHFCSLSTMDEVE